ncbi:MAG TPA: CBS domain-containing protein, partial [Acidimicrobiales bacterium]|nr:CBS domain-containing protein [Acidimicrobiales bacterium]
AEIAGIVSERDLVRALADGVDPDTGRVADVMSHDPRYLTLADHVVTAVEMMLDAGIRHLPVIEEGELVGIVSIRDLAASLAGVGSVRCVNGSRSMSARAVEGELSHPGG